MSVAQIWRGRYYPGQGNRTVECFYPGLSALLSGRPGISLPEQVNSVRRNHSDIGVHAAMSKLLLPSVLAFIVPMGAVAQAAQAPCTPPGIAGAQLAAVSRTGIGTPYTLTAIIKADAVTSKGINTTGGVTTSFQARDGQGRTPSTCQPAVSW
jgi:hypothetical protein